MALVEDDHQVAAVDLVAPVAVDERAQLLNSRHDDPSVRVLQLPLQNPRRVVRVRGALLEAVVLQHGLVVEVFAVHHEQHLLDAWQLGCQLRSLEAGERLARAGCVPHVPAGRDGAELAVVGGGLDAPENQLRRRDLIGAHHQQQAVGSKHAIPREDVQQGVLREERLGEAGQLANRVVPGVGPPAGEVEGVRRPARTLRSCRLLQVLTTGCVAVVLGQRAIRDDEQLHVLEQT